MHSYFMEVLQSHDRGYSQPFAPFQKSPSGAGMKPVCRLHLGDLGSPWHWGQGTEQHQVGRIPRTPAQAGFYPSIPASIPPVPPGDMHPRAEGTGDADSHGHSTAALHPPPPRSCTHRLAALILQSKEALWPRGGTQESNSSCSTIPSAQEAVTQRC